MKILTQDENTLVTSDKEYKQLIMGIVFAFVGILLFLFGLSKHSIELLVVGIALFAYMIYVAFFNRKRRQLTIDKRSGQATVVTKSVHGPTTNTYAISNIDKVLIVKKATARTSDLLSLYLVLKDGTNVDISDSQQMYGFLSSASNSAVGKVGQQIATYLNVPFDQSKQFGIFPTNTGSPTPTNPPTFVQPQ